MLIDAQVYCMTSMIYFDHHLPLKPSIGKWRKQSCTSNIFFFSLYLFLIIFRLFSTLPTLIIITAYLIVYSYLFFWKFSYPCLSSLRVFISYLCHILNYCTLSSLSFSDIIFLILTISFILSLSILFSDIL